MGKNKRININLILNRGAKDPTTPGLLSVQEVVAHFIYKKYYSKWVITSGHIVYKW